MPPKPSLTIPPTIPSDPHITSSSTPTIPFPEFSNAALLSFTLDAIERKSDAPEQTGKKAPAGKKKDSAEVNWDELVERNWKYIEKEFVREFGKRGHEQETPEMEQNEENGEEQEELGDQEAPQTDAPPQQPASEIEWRPMNRLATVLRKQSPAVSHPFADAFDTKAELSALPTPEDESLIDQDLLHDFIANQKDQLEQYARSSSAFKLPDSDLVQFMMKPFISALYYIIQNQQRLNISLGFGNYLWELIYPKRDVASQLPMENNEVYVVKLWYKGSWRMVAVDSQMPYHLQTKQLQLPQTKGYEYWPAILMKALMVLVGGDSERSQNLLFRDPLWCVQALCGPYLPRTLNTSNSLQCLREIRGALSSFRDASQRVNELVNVYARRKYLSIKKHETSAQAESSLPPAKLFNAAEDDIPQNDCFLCATCVSPNELNTDEDDQYFYDVGLDPALIYQIFELRYVKGKAVLHVLGYNQDADWEGDLSYSDSNVWDADFEEELGALRQDRLIPGATTALLVRDFWIPFEQFQQYFTSLHILQNVSNLRRNGALFGENLRSSFLVSTDTSRTQEIVFSLYYLTQEESVAAVLEDPKAKKGAAAKKSAPEPTTMDQDSQEVDNVGPYDLVTISVESYDWNVTTPTRKLTQISTYQMYDNLVRVVLPAGRSQEVLKISVEGYSRSRTLLECYAPLYDDALVIGTEDEILLSKMGMKRLQFQPQAYAAQTPNEWRIWFMQDIAVSSEVWFGANLKIVSQESTESEEPDAQEESTAVESTAPPTVPLIDLLPHVNLIIIDNTTRKTHHAALGCQLYPLKISVPVNSEVDSKAKKGAGPIGSYTLVAMAKAPKDKSIASGKYALEILHQDPGLESIRPLENLYRSSVKGTYTPSHTRELFNYVLWAGENALASLHLELDRIVPTTLLIENESGEAVITAQIDERSSRALHISIPPIQIEPSQKNQEKCLVVRALVDEAYAHRMLHQYQRDQAAITFASHVEQTPVEEPPPEPAAQDDKKGGKKGGKAPPKPAAKGKGKGAETGGRQVKIPAKQTEPQITKTIPNINPHPVEITTEDITNAAQNKNADCLQYSLSFTFTNPNIIIEEFDTRAEKVSALMNSWEEKEAGRLENGALLRNAFYKQRARDYDSQGRKDVSVVGNVVWEQCVEHEAEWLLKSRWRPGYNENPSVVSDPAAQETFIEHLEERIVQHEERIQATLDALREQCKLDPTTWSYQLKQLDEELQAQHKQILSTFEEAHRVRAQHLGTILREVEERLADLEKRKLEHAKNAKKGGAKKK